jgi:hypothetical protein
MAVFDDGMGGGPQLYVGGGFTSAGGVNALNIARWNGSTWSAVGDGLNAFVTALTVHDDGLGGGPRLYAGGSFTASGINSVRRVARWNGSMWESLGHGPGGSVYDLAVFDGPNGQKSLYAGGSRVERWNGAEWSAVGQGTITGSVYTLESVNDGPLRGLYAGGDFTIPGQPVAENIALWDGKSWSALAGSEALDFDGPFTSVRALAHHKNSTGTRLYLGCNGEVRFSFPTIPQTVLQWDGSSWEGLGLGMYGEPSFASDHDVLALAIDSHGSQPSLLAAGWFDVAWGLPANSIGRWTPAGAYQDVNLNLAQDECDIATGYSTDCNLNGLPDETESPWRYLLDDGVPSNYWGTLGAASWLYVNQFTVQPGAEIITHVGMLWSPYAPQVLPVKALVYSDPNNDGNPHDAVLLAQADAANIWIVDGDLDSDFAAIPVGTVHIGPPGTSFFVGGFVSASATAYPIVADLQPPLGRSFSTGAIPPGTVNLQAPFAHLQFAPSPQTKNWRLRALSMDCNDNGVPDLCDIDDGVSIDINRDGIPDECQVTCAEDVSPPGDGNVNITDLLFIIANWGTANGPADINDDGAVNIQDLLAVITAWGPCD